MFVTSNQSAAYELFPLLHGETSEMMTLTGAVVVPGEPVPWPSEARNAPLTPAVLNVEIVGSGSTVLPMPAVLSNVKPVVEAPKLTPVTRFPVEQIHSVAASAQAHARAGVAAN